MRVVRKTVRLHRVQYEFRHSPALYRAFVGGVSTGKSFVGTYDLIRRARRGRTYMVVGPTYTSLQDSTMKSFLGVARTLGVLDPAALRLSAPPQLTLSFGADVLFRSADRPEMLRGPNLSGMLLDEASLMPRLVYDVGIGRLREGGEQGWLSATFTPKGPTHWTFEAFATGRPDTAIFQARTRDNPFNPPGFEAAVARQYGETQFARQELGGEFVQIEGAEFPAEWFDWPGFWFEDWPAALVFRVVYLDPSKGRDARGGDYQCYCLAGLGRDGTIYLDAELNREPVPAMIARGVRLCREWGPVDSLLLEDNGTMGFIGPEVERQAREAGVLLPWQTVTSREPKLFRIRGLGGYLSRRQVRVRNTPGGRLLRAQLGDVPFGQHDDGPDAASGAVRMLERLTIGR